MSAPAPSGDVVWDAFARRSVGVAILCRDDQRALDIGLASLASQSRQADEILVVQIDDGGRGVCKPHAGPARVDAVVLSQPAQNARNVALERLARHDVVLLMTAGSVLQTDAVALAASRFEADDALKAALFTSRRYIPQRSLPASSFLVEPSRTLARFARSRSAAASLYFMPAILAVAPRRGPTPRFETFAQRSDWAAGRLFLDRVGEGQTTASVETDCFACIGGAPDRRDGYRQGEQSGTALLQFAIAYPQYRETAAADIRRLFLEQLWALAFREDRKATLAFLSGLVDCCLRERALRRRLRRDIGQLG